MQCLYPRRLESNGIMHYVAPGGAPSSMAVFLAKTLSMILKWLLPSSMRLTVTKWTDLTLDGVSVDLIVGFISNVLHWKILLFILFSSVFPVFLAYQHYPVQPMGCTPYFTMTCLAYKEFQVYNSGSWTQVPLPVVPVTYQSSQNSPTMYHSTESESLMANMLASEASAMSYYI